MPRERLAHLRFRLVHPDTTVRWRLTLLYGGLFLASGAVLLIVTYGLVAHVAIGPAPPFLKAGGGKLVVSPQVVAAPGQALTPAGLSPGVRQVFLSQAGRAAVRLVGGKQRIADLHQLIVESGVALAIMAIISALLGWLVAGRVLRPLRAITVTTRQISEDNLHQRLAMKGPRDELRTLADTIDGLLERLEGAFNAQRRFVANASHELRTPLTSSRALLEMAMSDPSASVMTFRETCRQALEENEHQERLINALLALAQGQRGIDRHESIELGAVARDAVGAYAAEAAEHDLTLEVAAEPATILGDRWLIDRLVSNLVENAVRHNIPGGSVRVQVESRDTQAVLAVINTGPPVPPDQIDRLLQPFQRLAPDRAAGASGLGLGLSIVAAIAAGHDAALDIRPGASGGLEIYVRFVQTTGSATAPPLALSAG